MAASLCYVVTIPSGQEVGRFDLPPETRVSELQRLIESLGPPVQTQQLLAGSRVLGADEALGA